MFSAFLNNLRKKNENVLKLFGKQLSYIVLTWIVFDKLKFFFL